MRIRLDMEYDGTRFSGWQRQDNAHTIQERIEEAIEKATGVRSTVHGSGRTDAGVHALQQTAHFDTDTRIPPERLAYALNFYLPPDIRILRSLEVPDDFHARYSATGKTYRYTFRNTPQASAVFRDFSAHEPRTLDLSRMQKAAEFLTGTHDFASFCAHSGLDKNTVRTIAGITVTRSGDYIVIEVSGNGFLHNMVRIIAGTLAAVGREEIEPEDIPRILEARNRLEAGITAPASGLMLVEVRYGADAQCASAGVSSEL